MVTVSQDGGGATTANSARFGGLTTAEDIHYNELKRKTTNQEQDRVREPVGVFV